MNPSMKDPRAWIEVTPDLFVAPESRSADTYVAAMKQFEVETNPRYVRGHDGDPKNGQETYCNIFLWDCTKALRCEVPHWVDPATGVEVPIGKGKELSANGVCDWFATHALKFGWMSCGKQQAQARATKGFPTVVLWKNTGGIGHVGMILPGTDFVHLAQAGGSNFFDKDIVKGFGNVVPLLFYTHD
jgi:hypothetical protein